MKKTTWTPAIAVEDPDTHILRSVRSVRQAQDVLQHHWPSHDGSRFRNAESACARVLDDAAGPDEARKAFIAAAIEAHLHLR
jgi:hypothetical protein